MNNFIKWTGGKKKEIKYFKHLYPQTIDRYIEPFVGGGSVYFNLNHNLSIINDKDSKLIYLYQLLQDDDLTNDFIYHLENLEIFRKKIELLLEENSELTILKNIDFYYKKIFQGKYFDHYMNKEIFDQLFQQHKNIRTSMGTIILHSIIYYYARYYINYNHFHNNKLLYVVYWYYVKEFCYSSMVRHNKQGLFNVPYGRYSYNKKNFQKKIDYFKDKKLIKFIKKTSIFNLDFEEFFYHLDLKQNDFIFLDPPYDTAFSQYDNKNFDKNEQIRLQKTLKNIESHWLLVIKNTDFIYDLYKEYNIETFDKKYNVNFKNRNKRDVEHLIIKNY